MTNVPQNGPPGNDPENGPPGNDPEISDSTALPATHSSSDARPAFSVIRVIVTVLLVAGLGGGAFLFFTQPGKPPALVEFSGQVFYKDKPLTTGGIFTETFEPGLIGAVGALDNQGRFTLMTNGEPGAYVGQHRLAVSALGSGNPPAPIVPERYVQPRTSPLIIDVSADPAKNTCKLMLVDSEDKEIEPSAATPSTIDQNAPRLPNKNFRIPVESPPRRAFSVDQ